MKRLLSLSVFLMIAAVSFAHDFEVVNADGKTIYCNITSSSDLTVAVTYQGTYSDARHAVGDGNWGHAATFIERKPVDARHAICLPIIGDSRWNGDITSIFIAIFGGKEAVLLVPAQFTLTSESFVIFIVHQAPGTVIDTYPFWLYFIIL